MGQLKDQIQSHSDWLAVPENNAMPTDFMHFFGLEKTLDANVEIHSLMSNVHTGERMRAHCEQIIIPALRAELDKIKPGEGFILNCTLIPTDLLIDIADVIEKRYPGALLLQAAIFMHIGSSLLERVKEVVDEESQVYGEEKFAEMLQQPDEVNQVAMKTEEPPSQDNNTGS